MSDGGYRIALLYDDSGYVETLRPQPGAPPTAPAGLMGRQVAGKEFLEAFLRHGSWEQLVALVYNEPSARSLARLMQTHPGTAGRPWRMVGAADFLGAFFPEAPAPLLYTPCPPDARFAWVRQHAGPSAYALCGVTHTLATQNMTDLLCGLVTAPYEPFDALICTSQAVADMVRSLTDTYAGYLRERHGGTPGLKLRLETIPLGVDTDKFRPATGEERVARRRALGVSDEEVVVLFVGRFAAHAKAHPVPMFQALGLAARAVGRPVHLILAGWGHESMVRAYAEAPAAFAPGLRVSVVDGTAAAHRFSVWHAADLFTSLSDSIQETFGLVVIEAMACGLPVVASDWDGYRDLVDDGVTGYRVPTYLVPGATADATARLVLGATDYDLFLAECNQATAVDVLVAAEAYAQLLSDAALRRKMGEAGRKRAVERYAWPRVVRAYEELWRGQERERRAWAARAAGGGKTYHGPAIYPAPEDTFAGYATGLLEDEDRLCAVAGAEEVLPRLLERQLTSYAETTRCRDQAVLRAVLEAARAPVPLAGVDEHFRRAGVRRGAGRATAAWMLKYGLLRVVPSGG